MALRATVILEHFKIRKKIFSCTITTILGIVLSIGKSVVIVW